MTAYDVVTDALRTAGLKVTESSSGARAQCPGHQSRGLSLALRPAQKDDGPVGLKCFAGCQAEDVLDAVGLQLKDLYEDKDSRTWTPPRPRRQPSPWDLLGDINHFCDRIIQQEAIDAGPPFPRTEIGKAIADLDELDAAWARHVRRETAPEYGQGGGDGCGEWSPERKAAFAEFRTEVDAREGR